MRGAEEYRRSIGTVLKKNPTKKPAPKPIQPDVAKLDLDPDAWPKFEKLVKSAAKMGPKPRNGEKPKGS